MLKASMVMVFTLSLLSNVMAQNEAKNRTRSIPFEDFIVDDSVNRYSLGINTHFGIEMFQDTYTTADIDLILRKQVGKYNAIRYGITYTSLMEENVYEQSTHRSSTYSIGLAAGYEWQTLLSRRWKWYYGADLRIATRLNRRKNVFTDDPEVSRYGNERYFFNLLPFTGFRYNITPNIFLSTEFKIVGEYNFRSGDEYYEITSNYLNVRFQPYSGIFIHYIF